MNLPVLKNKNIIPNFFIPLELVLTADKVPTQSHISNATYL